MSRTLFSRSIVSIGCIIAALLWGAPWLPVALGQPLYGLRLLLLAPFAAP